MSGGVFQSPLVAYDFLFFFLSWIFLGFFLFPFCHQSPPPSSASTSSPPSSSSAAFCASTALIAPTSTSRCIPHISVYVSYQPKDSCALANDFPSAPSVRHPACTV